MSYQPRFQEISGARLQEILEADTRSGKVSVKARVEASTYAQDLLRLEVRGQPAISRRELPAAPWNHLLLRSRGQLNRHGLDRSAFQFGFAVYLTAYHNIYGEEWEWVKGKVEEHVRAWGVGVSGAEGGQAVAEAVLV
ncbi:hypothetical protein BJX64DRAFT_294157 [Aspergillus heterothallicus]